LERLPGGGKSGDWTTSQVLTGRAVERPNKWQRGPQRHRTRFTSEGDMRIQFCISILAIVAVSASAPDAQTIPERVRANPTDPVIGGVNHDVRPVALERLAKEATVVVIARLHSPRSYLTTDQLNVLTDYVIQPEQVLAGSFPTVQQAPGQSAT